MFALIYQINFWQRKNMSEENSSLDGNLRIETKQKEVLLQRQNKPQGNLGTENKLKVSKKSGKMKYVFFAVAVILFIIAGLVLLNILLQFVVIKEIFSVIIIGSSGLFGVLSYISYKNIDTKELVLQMQKEIDKAEKPINKNAKLEIQGNINKVETLSKNKSRNIVLNQIIVEESTQKGSGKNEVITQNANNVNNKDIENEKLNKLLKQLKGNGLTVEYNFENKN